MILNADETVVSVTAPTDSSTRSMPTTSSGVRETLAANAVHLVLDAVAVWLID